MTNISAALCHDSNPGQLVEKRELNHPIGVTIMVAQWTQWYYIPVIVTSFQWYRNELTLGKVTADTLRQWYPNIDDSGIMASV